MANRLLRVEVAYAEPGRQRVLDIAIATGSTLEQALRASGILEEFPGIDLLKNKVGVFGRVCSLQQPLQQGDRVEIYRPLLMDPKDLRRQRAAGK